MKRVRVPGGISESERRQLNKKRFCPLFKMECNAYNYYDKACCGTTPFEELEVCKRFNARKDRGWT